MYFTELNISTQRTKVFCKTRVICVFIIIGNACGAYGQLADTAGGDSTYVGNDSVDNRSFLKQMIPDSLYGRNKLNQWHRGTSVVVSHEYGIPQIITESGSLHLTAVQVNSQIDLFKLPVLIDGYYTSQQPYTGFGSMFTIRLDVQALKDRKSALNGLAIDELKEKLKGIDKEIFDLESALSFQGGRWSRSTELNIDRPSLPPLPSDSSLQNSMAGYLNTDGVGLDSLPINTTHANLNHGRAYKDSIWNSVQNERAVAYEKIDSLAQLLESLKQKRALALNTLTSVEEGLASNSNLLDTRTSGFAAKAADVLKQLVLNANKLEVGMAGPNNSEFLIRGLPLLGLHMETMLRNHYVSVSTGRLYNPRVFGALTKETGNFLSFMGVPRRASQYNALQLKGGVGSMYSSHIHFGVLAATSVNFVIPERRTVYEGDLLLKTKNFTAQITSARSNLPRAGFEEELPTAGTENAEPNMFASMATQGKLLIPIRSTKTTVTGKIEYTGSSFHSPGIGFQRPGLLMYRADIKQRVGKKTTFSAFYGREYDGLLINQASYNAFERWGASVQQKIGKSFMVFAEFSPIKQQVIVEAGEVIPDDPFSQLDADSIAAINTLGSSYLVNGGLNWTKRLGEVTMNAYAMGQYYSLKAQTGIDIGSYFLSLAMFSLDWAGKMAVQMGFNILNPLNPNGYLNNRNTLNAGGSYTMDSGICVSASGELIQEGDEPLGMGYGGKVDVPLGESFRLSLEASKLVNDRYSQSFLNSHFGIQDPFQIRTSLIWKI